MKNLLCVTIVGGNEHPDTGLVHPNFKRAKIEAILDNLGRLVTLQINDPGAYYYTNPDILLNDQNFSESIDVNVVDIGVFMS